MIELAVLAIGLSFDAFAVSIALGARQQTNPRKLALTSGFYFGLFQGLMPFISFWAGQVALKWLENYVSWIASGFLFIIGIKMLYELIPNGVEQNISQITWRIMLLLAIATSIDALAAGFVLGLLNANLIVACILIGLTTFTFSYAGVYIGVECGTQLGIKAQAIGGCILIILGIKFLLA